jgi:UDP-glucose:(heptosyl)LPS alpha-1,3-glucosyltransferase
LRAIARSAVGARLWVVGKGRHARYAGLSRELGIESRVTFWGPREDVVPFYAAADLFVLPTIYDPFPSVVLEAMASALPVITTMQCGAAEVIGEGVEGFLVPSPGAVELMADRIDLLCDADRRETMGLAARRKAEHFSIDRTVSELKELYDGLLNERAGLLG